MKILIGIFVVIVGGILWWARSQCVIGVNPATMTVPRDASVTFDVQLMYKPWFKRTFDPIHGTINWAAPRTLASIAPPTITTQPTGTRTATFTVTGLASGTGKIIVNGTSRKGSHDTAEISFNVP